MAMDESGSIENSPAQLNELSDERLKEILGSSRHGHNNKRWAMDILTERRERLEKSLAVIAESITSNTLVDQREVSGPIGGVAIESTQLLETLADIHKEFVKKSEDAAGVARAMAEEKAYDLAGKWQAWSRAYTSAALAVESWIDKVSNASLEPRRNSDVGDSR